MKMTVKNIVTKKTETFEVCCSCGRRIPEQNANTKAMQNAILVPATNRWRVA